MSAESQFTLTITSTVSGVAINKVSFSAAQNRTNTGFNQGAIVATSTHAQLQIQGTVTEQYCLVQNKDATNVVHLQTSNSGSTGRFATLPPGGPALLPLSAATALWVVCESGQTATVTYTLLSD